MNLSDSVGYIGVKTSAFILDILQGSLRLGRAWLPSSRGLKGSTALIEILERSFFFMEKISTPSKRLRSNRSSTSSIASSSPMEKCPKSNINDLERCEGQVEVKGEAFCIMPNTTYSQDIKPTLDKILKKLEKLDAIELTLRDISSRLTRAETAVQKLERDS